MSAIRPPIASVEAETALLGGLLLDAADGLARCFSVGLSPLAFTAPGHAALYAEIQTMHAAGEHVDAATVAERMRDRMAEIGGWQKLDAISSAAPTSLQTGFYAKEVAALHRRRQIALAASVLTEACYSAEASEEIPAALTRLNSVSTSLGRSEESKWPVVVADALAHAQRIVDRAPEINAATLDWPWPVFNRIFRQVSRGELVIIAARPSVGKSSLARAIAMFHAKAGRNVLFESLEDNPRSVAFQAAASSSGHSFTALSGLHATEQAEYLESLRSLAVPNLHVFSRDTSLAAINARAKSIQAQTPLDILIIDQLSHVSDGEPQRGENKSSAVGRVTRGAKKLAMDLGVPVFLLCQLSRQSVNDNNREPRLTDLRDSGEIEQDADRVVFLHRPDIDGITNMAQMSNEDASVRPRFFVNAIQAKGRSVGDGQFISLYFHRTTATFNPATNANPTQ